MGKDPDLYFQKALKATQRAESLWDKESILTPLIKKVKGALKGKLDSHLG